MRTGLALVAVMVAGIHVAHAADAEGVAAPAQGTVMAVPEQPSTAPDATQASSASEPDEEAPATQAPEYPPRMRVDTTASEASASAQPATAGQPASPHQAGNEPDRKATQDVAVKEVCRHYPPANVPPEPIACVTPKLRLGMSMGQALAAARASGFMPRQSGTSSEAVRCGPDGCSTVLVDRDGIKMTLLSGGGRRRGGAMLRDVVVQCVDRYFADRDYGICPDSPASAERSATNAGGAVVPSGQDAKAPAGPR